MRQSDVGRRIDSTHCRWALDRSWSVGRKPRVSSVLYYVPLIALLLWAATVDIRVRRVPNWISFGLALSGIILGVCLWYIPHGTHGSV